MAPFWLLRTPLCTSTASTFTPGRGADGGMAAVVTGDVEFAAFGPGSRGHSRQYFFPIASSKWFR